MVLSGSASVWTKPCIPTTAQHGAATGIYHALDSNKNEPMNKWLSIVDAYVPEWKCCVDVISLELSIYSKINEGHIKAHIQAYPT